MVKTEDAIASDVVSDLEASEVPAAPQGTTSLHGGGPGTSSMQYAPGGRMSRAAIQGQHENSGTRPLAGDYVAPTGGDGEGANTEEAREAREAAFKATVAQVKIDRAIADASFRNFCRGPVEPKGYVSGLEHLQALQDHERNKK